MTEPADGWIRVTERLPAHGEDVWLYSPHYARIEMGWLYTAIGRWRVTDGAEWELRKVTHWQPLVKPAPPKETTHAR